MAMKYPEEPKGLEKKFEKRMSNRHGPNWKASRNKSFGEMSKLRDNIRTKLIKPKPKAVKDEL